jgi:hypothetical protein
MTIRSSIHTIGCGRQNFDFNATYYSKKIVFRFSSMSLFARYLDRTGSIENVPHFVKLASLLRHRDDTLLRLDIPHDKHDNDGNFVRT